MRVTFFSNFLNHHQLPFCEAMVERLGTGFTFVACERTHQERIKMGYSEMNREHPFVLRAYESEALYAQARQLALESDLVIVGSAPNEFVDARMSTDQLTFRYSERLFKNGSWRRFLPTTAKKVYDSFTKHGDRRLYVLCASAFTAADLALCGFPADKCLQWGYFPEFKTHNLDALMERKRQGVPRLLWAGRLLHWKHPEHAVTVARLLKADGYGFEMDVIGVGPLEQTLRDAVRVHGLGDCVHLVGAITPQQVREHMERASVYIFTSDFREGWGAVLNEAMNSGCAVLASHAIGAVPFLMENERNGLIHRSGNVDDLYANMTRVLDDQRLCTSLGRGAYESIESLWNASVAADRLLRTVESLEAGEPPGFGDGPCSPARVLANEWFGG